MLAALAHGQPAVDRSRVTTIAAGIDVARTAVQRETSRCRARPVVDDDHVRAVTESMQAGCEIALVAVRDHNHERRDHAASMRCPAGRPSLG